MAHPDHPPWLVWLLQAVTRNELYGYLHPATREWKEGLISVTYRDMANNRTNKHQWILLDGDIDAEWIEVSAFNPLGVATARLSSTAGPVQGLNLCTPRAYRNSGIRTKWQSSR